MSESPTGQAQQRAHAPVSFRLSTYWRLPKGQAGVSQTGSGRLALPEVLDLLLQHLTEEEAAISSNGTAVVLTIDWSKVPMEVLNPFSFGARR